jgi:predicted DNA-binding transcriptional regulator AlpA
VSARADIVAAIDRLADAVATRATEPLCVDADELAVMLNVSARQVHRLNDKGDLPAPVELGGCTRWVLAEIRAWLRAGCPPRRSWSWSGSP